MSADDVPLVVTDFGGELGGGVKEVLPNAPGEALSVAFLAFCLDRESEAAALVRPRPNARLSLSADAARSRLRPISGMLAAGVRRRAMPCSSRSLRARPAHPPPTVTTWAQS